MAAPLTTSRNRIPAFVKFLAGFFALLLLLTLGVGLRLMLGPPIALRSLTPWFEAALSRTDYGIKATIEKSLLVWDKDRKSAVLNLANIEFKDRLEQKIGSIADVVVILKPLGYFDETRSPWAVNISEAHFYARVTRGGQMQPGVFGGDEAKPKEQKAEGFSTDTLHELLQDTLRHPHRRSGLGFFANLRLEKAGITLNDESRQITWNILVPELTFKRTRDDYTGKAEVRVIRNDMETALDFALNYIDEKGIFQASWSFDHLNPSFFTEDIEPLKAFDYIAAPLTGTISIDITRNFKVESGALNVNLDAGEIRLPDILAKPLPFSAGQIAARYDADSKKLTAGPVRIDLANAVLKGEAEMRSDKSPRPLTLRLMVEDVDMKHLPEYWPEDAGKNARDWILENIHQGQIEEATANLSLDIPEKGLADATVTHLDGAIHLRNAKLTAWKALPDITKANADSTFTDKGFDIEVHGGEMGDIKLGESKLKITGLLENEQIMDLQAPLSGPAGYFLSVLDNEPMQYARKIGIKPASVSGRADGTLNMKFPLLKDLPFDRVDIAADVKITNANIMNMVDLLDISGGDLALKVDKSKLTLNGKGEINGIQSSVDWLEQFSPPEGELLSKGQFKASARAEDAKKFGVGFEMRSSMPFPLNVGYERGAKTSKLTLHGDIKDTEFEIPAASYLKASGVLANFDVALEWGEKPMKLSNIAVKGEGVNVKGEGGFTGQNLTSLHLDPLKLGKTDARLDYKKDANKPALLTIKGAAVDITRFLAGDEDAEKLDQPIKTDEPPVPMALDIDVATLITGEQASLSKFTFKGERGNNGWERIDLKAMAKETPFNFALAPGGNGLLNLSASTPNIGDVFRALDVTDTVFGGKLNIEGKSENAEKRNTIAGTIKIERYRVTNMPVLAQLLSAISPDGIASLLGGGGNGLTFNELTGKFVWTRDAITLSKTSTSTGSLGLTTEGRIDLNESNLALKGQVVPVYFLNKILSSIPVIGTLLTGGEGGGIFAATYSVEGPVSKPKVSVNPVSVLAPGILRTILFSGSTPAEKTSPLPPGGAGGGPVQE